MTFISLCLLRDDDWTYGNDTPVWRKPPEAIEERFQIVEQADEGDIPHLLERYQTC